MKFWTIEGGALKGKKGSLGKLSDPQPVICVDFIQSTTADGKSCCCTRSLLTCIKEIYTLYSRNTRCRVCLSALLRNFALSTMLFTDISITKCWQSILPDVNDCGLNTYADRCSQTARVQRHKFSLSRRWPLGMKFCVHRDSQPAMFRHQGFPRR